MGNFLVVYHSKYGQTEKISKFIQTELVTQGHTVDIFECMSEGSMSLLSTYDGVIVGAPVYRSKFSGRVSEWVKLNLPLLHKKPSAFFSVCLGVLQSDPNVQADEKKIVTEFLEACQWRPSCWDIFAGSLPYSKYNLLVKFMMKYIAKKAGAITSIRRDYEYTDWSRVQKFVQTFVLSYAKSEKQKQSDHFEDSHRFKETF